MQKPTIIILHNQAHEESPEDVLDIVRQAEWIAEILSGEGYETRLLPFSIQELGNIQRLNQEKPLLVFNLVDSAPGEETLAYLVPGMLDYLRIPYTGCSLDNLYTTTNKMLAKRLLRSQGIDTPDWVCLGEAITMESADNVQYLVKPVSEDASVGLDDDSLVQADCLDTVIAAINRKQASTGKTCFAERFIEGREFTACMYGSLENPVILTPYEWVFEGFEEHHKAKIITYDAKWLENSFGYDHIQAAYKAAPCDKPLVDSLISIAKRCWKTFRLSGYARVDFRIDQQGRPWVLEVNCNPSFYGFYHLAKEAGEPFEHIVHNIVEIAMAGKV
ncbi:MAG: hypothetical protein WCX48_11880 [Bacteroidales bacterium]